MPTDPTQAFLQGLPEVRPGEAFWFACHPNVSCFNACCSDLTMPLTPYDVVRLRQGVNMGSEEFFEEFARVGCYPDTGFPLLHLRMQDDPSHLCPFVTEKGCGVYEHRSSACRTYPLGRATKPSTCPAKKDARAVTEQYFLVREDHCRGFAENKEWTTASWLQDQGLETYNRMNDRYMALVANYKSRAGEALLSGKQATMALMCLYQQDRFLDFVNSVGMLSRVRLTGEYEGQSPESLAERMQNDEDARLAFAFDWVELVTCGACPNLAPN